MTDPAPCAPGADAVIDGVDVDAVAAAARGCAGVSGLDGGPYHQVATYLPGRAVDGVAVAGGRVRVQVRSRWGVEVPSLATSIKTALAPLTGSRPVDVTIADIDDPPASGTAGTAGTAGIAGTDGSAGTAGSGPPRRLRPSPGLPPG